MDAFEDEIFDAPTWWYDLAVDASRLSLGESDAFFSQSHPLHEPKVPLPRPHCLLPLDEVDGDGAIRRRHEEMERAAAPPTTPSSSAPRSGRGKRSVGSVPRTKAMSEEEADPTAPEAKRARLVSRLATSEDVVLHVFGVYAEVLSCARNRHLDITSCIGFFRRHAICRLM